MLGFLARNWGLVVLRGVAAIVFGILTFISPIGSIAVLVLFWGVYALVDGVCAIVAAFKGPHPGGASSAAQTWTRPRAPACAKATP